MTNKKRADGGRIKRRSLLRTIGAGGTVALAGCTGGSSGGQGSGSGGGQGSTYTMAAGSSGSSTWATGQALQQVIRNNTKNIQITAQQTGGTRANLRLYSKGNAELIGTSNYLYNLAKQKQGPYSGNPIKQFPQQAFAYGVTHTYTLAREGTGIQTYDDLAGRTVWPLWSGSSIRLPYEEFLKAVGLWNQMNIRDTGPSDVAGALEAGRIDALAVYGVSFKGLSGWATQVDSRVSLNSVRMSEQKSKQLDEVLPTGSVQVKPYGWSNQDFGQQKLTAIPMNWNIFYGTEITKNDAYTMTKIVNQKSKQISDQVSIFPVISKPKDLVQGMMSQYSVHPGAAKYYKEVGVWNNDWTVGNASN